jgi:uncharacterized protein (TIGR02453 family)
MPASPHFGRELIKFLKDLRANNNREWFQANKQRYEKVVRDPLLRFVADFGPRLAKISPHFVADPRPMGGSLFRIYRDTRFSRDKSPYKTAAALHFRHEKAKDVHAPGFYLHLEPGNVFAGVGIWRPDAATLGQIRSVIVENPAKWKRAKTAKSFTDRYELAGESLKRAPKAYDPDHPLIEDLKRKDFVAFTQFKEADLFRAGFLGEYAKTARAAKPFMEFLTRAVGLQW